MSGVVHTINHVWDEDGRRITPPIASYSPSADEYLVSAYAETLASAPAIGEAG